MSDSRRLRRDAIDWSDVRRRLAEAIAKTDASEFVTPERARELMAERALVLARETASAPAPSETLDVLRFSLGRERYAIEARHVCEVVRLVDFTPVPGAGEVVLGVTNLRGEVLCVVDLRHFLGVRQRGLNDLSRIIVLGAEGPEFGVLADEAHEISGLHTRDLRPPPTSLAGIGREYLLGVTDDALLVLDGAVLLRDPRLFIDQSESAAG